MKNSIIDELNRVLTNTYEYKNVLHKVSQLSESPKLQDNLNEQVTVAEKESEELIQLISKLGGDVDSTERQTDQELIGWVTPAPPNNNKYGTLVNYLIEIEKNKRQDYYAILNQKETSDEVKAFLKNNIENIESQLEFYNSII